MGIGGGREGGERREESRQGEVTQCLEWNVIS